MKFGISRNVALLISLCLICIAAVPAVTATGTSTGQIQVVQSTPDQVKLINELWGSNITIGEYMEKVHPELLVGVSDAVKSEMYKQKMQWSAQSSTSSPSTANQVQPALASLKVTALETISSNHISFSGTATCTQSASYIYVEAFLKNAAGTTVGSTAASSHDGALTVSNSNMVFWPAAGNYYVYADGYTITPNLNGAYTTGMQYYSG